MAYLIENEVKLCVRLFHFVTLIQAEEGTTQKMLRVVHDNLKGNNVVDSSGQSGYYEYTSLIF